MPVPTARVAARASSLNDTLSAASHARAATEGRRARHAEPATAARAAASGDRCWPVP